MSCVPLSWTPELNLECTLAEAEALQLLLHTWGRIGKTSGMAPCQRRTCCTVPFPLLTLAEGDDWEDTSAHTQWQCSAKLYPITKITTIQYHVKRLGFILSNESQGNSWQGHTWEDYDGYFSNQIKFIETCPQMQIQSAVNKSDTAVRNLIWPRNSNLIKNLYANISWTDTATLICTEISPLPLDGLPRKTATDLQDSLRTKANDSIDLLTFHQVPWLGQTSSVCDADFIMNACKMNGISIVLSLT